MKLRTYLVLFSVLLVGIVMVALFLQTRNILEAGFTRLQETKLDNISQLLLSVIESKKEDLKNFSQAIRFNNDLSGAYVLSMETKDRELAGDKLKKIKKDTGLDLIDILSPTGRLFVSQNKFNDELKSSIYSEDGHSGSVLLNRGGQPMLVFYAPLNLYDQPVGTLLVGTLLDKLSRSKILKITDSKIQFIIGKNISGKSPFVRQIKILPKESDTPAFAVISLDKNFGHILKEAFFSKLLWLGPISILILVTLIYASLEFGFLRKFMGIVGVVQDYAVSVCQGKVCALSLKKHYIQEIDKMGMAFEQLSVALVQYKGVLQEKNKMEEDWKKQKALTELTQQVAHDICSPLSSMKTAMSYLENLDIKDQKFMDVTNLLELSAKRLTGIADGLLKKYKGDAPQNIIFSLHKILDELAGEYQGQEQYHGITFAKQYHAQAIELHGERAKLQRAFGNIIKNGMEAMKGTGIIEIRTASENGTAVVSIKDTGPGISPEKLERVLAGGFTEGKKEGHGIGSTVVHETVTEFGGKLWAESNPGEGTSFFIQLPLPSKEVLQKSPREETAMEQFTLRVFEKEPVIIIDDDPSLREQWRLVLVSQKRGVILCESHEDFERQKLSPQISKTAIIDYHFDNSELNGADIVRILQEKNFTNLYLCTAEYWKPSIQKLAKELNVKLCPKPLPKISMEVKKTVIEKSKEKKGYKVLVIDDEETIRLAWELMDRKLQIEKLYTFANLETLQKNNLDLSQIDIAFVDKNIAHSQFNGAQVVNYLKSQRVPKVILASGENQEELLKDPQFAQADFIVSEKIPTSFKEFFS